MDRTYSRSKYRNETISLVADFTYLLEETETISSYSVTVTLLTGTDSDPTQILYQVPIVSTKTLDQKFRLGVIGCIYEIVFQVTGSLGTIVDLVTSLAILPETGNAIPSFTFTYLTTYLYPYNTGDSMESSMLPYSGRAFGYIPEGMNSYMGPVSGSVYGSSVTYNIPLEILTSNPITPITGSIWGGQITYSNYFPEGVNGFMAPVTGSTFAGSISYSIPTTYEGLNISMSPTSGTIH